MHGNRPNREFCFGTQLFANLFPIVMPIWDTKQFQQIHVAKFRFVLTTAAAYWLSICIRTYKIRLLLKLNSISSYFRNMLV